MSRPAASLAASGLHRPAAAGGGAWLQRGLYHLLSFEAVFALYFYSNQLKLLFPPLPVNESAVLLLLSAVAGLYVILRGGLYVRGLPLLVAGLLFFAWATLSWGWSPSRRNAATTLTLLFSLNLWALIAGALIIAPSRERAVRFLAFVLIFSLVLAIAGLTIFMMYGTFRYYRGFKAAGFMMAQAYLSWGYAVTNGGIIAFAWIAYSRMLGLRQLLAVACFAICAGFLMINGGRGPFLCMALGCAVAVLAGLPQLSRGRIRIPRWQAAAAILLVIAGGYGAYLVASGVYIATFQSFINLMGDLQRPELGQGAERLTYYALAIEQWLRAPILGNGIASFPYLRLGRDDGSGPHNLVLEVLCELGLVGLGLLLLLFWTGLRHVRLAPGHVDMLQVCMLMLLVGRLATAMISYSLPEQWPLLLWLALLLVRPRPAATVVPGQPARVRPQLR